MKVGWVIDQSVDLEDKFPVLGEMYCSCLDVKAGLSHNVVGLFWWHSYGGCDAVGCFLVVLLGSPGERAIAGKECGVM
jgi:hypothetical protein